MGKAFFSTMGCAISHKEGQLYSDYFASNGWTITQKPSKADVLILNLCSVSKTREDYHLDYIRKIKGIQKKGSKLIIVGCIAKINQKEVEELDPHACVPPNEIHRLDEILEFDKSISEISERGVVQENPIFVQLKGSLLNDPVKKLMSASAGFMSLHGALYKYVNMPYEHLLNKKSYTITIATGCLNKCSYCAIRLARGKLKSIPSEQVMGKVKEAVDQGFKKIHLLGTNPCQYGLDRKDEIDYYELLRRSTALPGDFRLVLPDLDPNSFVKNFDRMREILATKKVMEITFSVQSGSPRIIKAMNRHYDIDAFKECFREARQTDPRTKLNAHIIVGFPGETDAEHNTTFSMIRELRFDRVLLFDYGDRPGTPSSEFPGHVSPDVMKKRIDELHKWLFFSFLKDFLRNPRRAFKY